MLTRTAIAIVMITIMCSPFALAQHVEIDDHGIHVDGVSLVSAAHAGRHTRDIERTGDLVVEKGETVRDASAISGSVTVRGHVTQDATAVGGNVVVEKGGRVDGDATAVAGKVIVRPGGVVMGDKTTLAPNFFRFVPRWALWHWSAPGWLWVLGGTVLYAVLSAVVVALFPRRTEMIAATALERPGWSLLYAIVGLLLIVPIMVLLILTILGIPLIAVEFIIAAAAWIMGSIAVALAVGQRLSAALGRPIPYPVLAAVVGTLVIGIVRLVPFAGDLLVGILALFGFGAVLITGFGTHPDWTPDRLRRRAVRESESPRAGEPGSE